jgi:hypothetical protein
MKRGRVDLIRGMILRKIAMTSKFVPITENISNPVPEGLTPEKEKELIEQFKKDHDLAEMDADYLDFAKQIERGNLVPAEIVLKKLEEMEQPFKKESA